VRLDRRHRDIRRGERRERQQRDGRRADQPALEHGGYFAAGAGLLKSTTGGLAMAFSSSTVKFGLTL